MIDNANKQILNGENIACERISGVNDNMPRAHYHEFYEIYYLESGQRTHIINGKLFNAKPGELLIFEPYMVHLSYGEQDVPFCRLVTYFKESELLTDKLKNSLHGISGAYTMPIKEGQQFYRLLCMIYAEKEKKQAYSEEYCRTLLNELLILLLRNRQEQYNQTAQNPMTKVVAFINTNYADSLSLEKIASQFYISPFSLCRDFKKFTNSTVIQYINETRILKAKQLLLNTNNSITDICYEVGYNNVTHFGRVFHQMTGSTPREFRKQL